MLDLDGPADGVLSDPLVDLLVNGLEVGMLFPYGQILKVRVASREGDQLNNGQCGRGIGADLREMCRQPGGDPILEIDLPRRRFKSSRQGCTELAFEHGAEQRCFRCEAVVESAVWYTGARRDGSGRYRADTTGTQDCDRSADELLAAFLDAAVFLLEAHDRPYNQLANPPSVYLVGGILHELTTYGQ